MLHPSSTLFTPVSFHCWQGASNWPMLWTLNLTWALLKELSLCHSSFSLAWLALLSQAAWPLVRKFSITLFDDGLPSQFGYDPNCNADAISRLMRVGWQLEELTFSIPTVFPSMRYRI